MFKTHTVDACPRIFSASASDQPIGGIMILSGHNETAVADWRPMLVRCERKSGPPKGLDHASLKRFVSCRSDHAVMHSRRTVPGRTPDVTEP